MHNIEPFYNWRHTYTAEEDKRSPFYQKEYSEFFFSEKIYDHFIHPQWDSIESETLFIKLLYCNYSNGFCIIEIMGEWNDIIGNDIMQFKHNFIDLLMQEGINKFILIGENVLNFHAGDEDYYEEWFDEIEDGWIALLNFREHVLEEMQQYNIDSFFVQGGVLNDIGWRTLKPQMLFNKVNELVQKRLYF